MHVAHPGTSHDNTKPCMMRLIINASLQQVNLVWSTVSVLKADAPASYPGNQSSPAFPLLSKVHTQYWMGGVDFISYTNPGLQGHTTPLPVLTPCHSPASHFYGSAVPGITSFPLTLFLTHWEITSFYSHFSTKLETQALSKSLLLK